MCLVAPLWQECRETHNDKVRDHPLNGLCLNLTKVFKFQLFRNRGSASTVEDVSKGGDSFVVYTIIMQFMEKVSPDCAGRYIIIAHIQQHVRLILYWLSVGPPTATRSQHSAYIELIKLFDIFSSSFT